MPRPKLQLDWLLLMYSLPARRTSLRVGLWRQLKKAGAVAFKTSTYVLPDTPPHVERCQWLAQQVRDGGGDATIVHASDIEGTSDEAIIRLFNDARAAEYAELISALSPLVKSARSKAREGEAELRRATTRYEEIRGVDFFACEKREVAAMMLGQLREKVAGSAGGGAIGRVPRKQFQNQLWLTRPRPEIDRVGSAWLIRRFIDPGARFVFSTKPEKFPEAVTFDMVDGRFSHIGDDCTFETLRKAFAIEDGAARRIGEMVHAADLMDEKFSHAEGIGIDRVLKGWALQGCSDEKLLEKGAELFDALHEYLRKKP